MDETSPTTLTREELHKLVWETPMIRLGERIGISGNGLAKICRRLEIPYPPRGHWAKKEAGKKVSSIPLPRAQDGIPLLVTIRPTEANPEQPEAKLAVAQAEAKVADIQVAERLRRPHQIIAGWLADHEERKREARRQRDQWSRDLIMPAEFTEQDRRRHRILNALFKELERQGARIIQGDRRKLFVEVSGQKVEFDLREKQKQVRRPLTAEERRWSSNPDGMKQELQPSGLLVFEIKTYLVGSLRREWLEKPDATMEELLPQIVATLVAAGPLLAERRRAAEEAEHLRAIEQRRLEEIQQKRRQDQNRGRRLLEVARTWRDVTTAREFLAALRNLDLPEDQMVEGKLINDWVL